MRNGFGQLAVLIMMLGLVACGGQEATPAATSTPAGFDRRGMLENVATQLILPGHERLVTAMNDLAAAVHALDAGPTPATLDAAQDAWLAANLARMAVAVYELGPVADSLIHNRLDNRPARVPFVENELLAKDTPITPAYLDSVGSTSVGLGVVEYLLFDPAGGDAAVLASLTTAPDVARRRELLAGLADAMTRQATDLLAIWSAGGGDYARAFIEAEMDGGELQGSINMLVNKLVADYEEIINTRLGQPLGKRSEGLIRPDLVEAPYSGASLPRIIATVEALRTAFRGGDGAGLDDYLDFLGATATGGGSLAAAIDAQFEAALAALRAIDGPLETAIAQNPAQVEAAYEELRLLLPLLKADLVGQLGITVTFSDNDGD